MPVFFLCPHPGSRPTSRDAAPPSCGWSFLKPKLGSRPPARQPLQNMLHGSTQELLPELTLQAASKLRKYVRHVSEAFELRPSMGSLFQLSTLSDWEQRAKQLDRSLDAYTPAPSTSSSMRALVRSWGSLPSPLERIGRLFSGEASGLDAFSPYPR
jgi:hypothetical protein